MSIIYFVSLTLEHYYATAVKLLNKFEYQSATERILNP